MGNSKDAKKYIPLTHTTYFILLSLVEPLHGYGIMQMVEEMSEGDVKLGPGTLYGALNKLQKEKLIMKVATTDERRKIYVLSELGQDVIKLEYERLRKLTAVSDSIIERLGDENHE